MKTKNYLHQAILFFLIIVILTGCTSKTIQTEETMPSDLTTKAATATQQPSPTETLVPTNTSEPTSTPTTSPPQPAPLSKENIQNIQLISTSQFFQSGSLQEAEWSPDGKLLVVITSKDLQIVDSETLEILYTIQDYDFVHFLDNGNLVLKNDQGLPFILDSQSHSLYSLDLEIPSNELGYDIDAYAISYDGQFLADMSLLHGH